MAYRRAVYQIVTEMHLLSPGAVGYPFAASFLFSGYFALSRQLRLAPREGLMMIFIGVYDDGFASL